MADREAATLDVLDPEQDDGDVVAAAGTRWPRRSACPPPLAGWGLDQRGPDLPLRDHRGEPVAAQQHDVAGTQRIAPGVDLDDRLGSERAGDDRTLRVLERLLLGQLASAAAAPRRANDPRSAASARRPGAGRRGCRRRERSRHDRRRDRRRSGWSPYRRVALGLGALVDLAVGPLDDDGQPLLGGTALGQTLSNVSTAICDATSPACAPPIPSAITNTGARAYEESSLPRRWRPVSVRWIVSAARSM